MITGQIQALIDRYPLTVQEKQRLVEELVAFVVHDRLESLAAIKRELAKSLEAIEAEVHPETSLAGKSIRELQHIARSRGLPYRNLDKAQLMRLLSCADKKGGSG